MANWIAAFVLINILWLLVLKFKEDDWAETLLWMMDLTPEEFAEVKRNWETFRDEKSVH